MRRKIIRNDLWHRLARSTCPWIALAGVIAHLSAVSASPKTQVREAEAALADAIASRDGSAWSRLVAENFLQIDAEGRLHDRSDPTIIIGLPPVSDGLSLHVHDSVSIVIGRAANLRVMRVWVRNASGWQLASEQAVAIRPGEEDPEPPPQLLANMHPPPALDERLSTVADVLGAQDALDRANVSHDPTTFARLTDADFVVVTNHGLVRTKGDRILEEQVARLESRPERPMPRRDDIRVRIFEHAAIVTVRNWPRTFEGAPRPPSRSTRVWVHTTGGWRQIANISTIALQPID